MFTLLCIVLILLVCVLVGLGLLLAAVQDLTDIVIDQGGDF